MHPSPSEPPRIEYRLWNYGKSPAIVQSVLLGMWIEDIAATGTKREYVPAQEAMEIVGVGEQSRVLTCNFEETFTFGDCAPSWKVTDFFASMVRLVIRLVCFCRALNSLRFWQRQKCSKPRWE